MYRAAMLSALLLAAFGCAVRKPDTYRLIRESGRTVLVPPGVSRPDLGRRSFQVPIAGSSACAAAGGVAIQRRGRNLRITLTRDSLVRQPAGWLSRWAAEAEANGCVAPGLVPDLAARILQALPLDPAVAWRLVDLNHLRAGYTDLASGTRLQVDSPIFREGTPPDAPAIDSVTAISGSGNSITVDLKASPNLLGYERAWYAVRQAPGRPGSTIVPLTAERHVNGQMEVWSAPAIDYFRFDSDAAYYRLLYRADRTIIVLGTPNYAELDRLSHQIDADPGACPAHRCALIPANVGVNPEIVVTVNGKECPLPVGSNVTG